MGVGAGGGEVGGEVVVRVRRLLGEVMAAVSCAVVSFGRFDGSFSSSGSAV